ncbi:MAG: hypothetical protein JW882_13495 [Deltaproteobacteria bacterium]|nr:hypothetical protein [Deltaproteobacteria bacterium]
MINAPQNNQSIPIPDSVLSMISPDGKRLTPAINICDTLFLSNLKRKVGDHMALRGGIYSSQKCNKCGGKFKDNGKYLACPDHPDQKTTTLFVRYPGDIFIRFNDYDAAKIFLAGLQLKDAEGSLDSRDYKKAQPLGFANLVKKWLDVKEKKDKVRCMRNLRSHTDKAIAYFGNINIKLIGYAELEDFITSNLLVHAQTGKPLSSKTKANIIATLHSFWGWVARREKKNRNSFEIPEFPEIDFESSMRNTLDRNAQIKVLERIRELTWHINPKIYIGCLWLATYVNMRPNEMINVKESDIDIESGIMYIRVNKEGRADKKVFLLDEDIELIKSLRPEHTLPGYYDQYFFRHGRRKGVSKSKRLKFGKDYLYKWWKTACNDLGIEDVDLYGGTRHSSITNAGDEFSYNEIMDDGTGHVSSRSFLRYYQLKAKKKRAISSKIRPALSAPDLHRENEQAEADNILKL